jgi:hypothetical protein
MTQAYNLSQFANNLTSAGQADLTTAVVGTLPYTNGGTGLNTLGTVGQVLTSDGAAIVWGAGGGGGGGSVADGTMYENSLDITNNYTLSTGKNAMSVGPITIALGVTVTIPSDQRWVIL